MFDFYGTLVEDDFVVPPIWELLRQRGFESGPELQEIFEPDAFDGCRTPSVSDLPSHDEWCRENWLGLLRVSGVPEDLQDEVLDDLLRRQSLFSFRSVTSAVELLDELRERGVKVGLCSNWESSITGHLQKADLERFDGISVSAEVGARKPHSDIFLDICSKLSVKPEHVVFVGDKWTSDIIGSLRVGMTPVWIRRSEASRGLTHLVTEFESLHAFREYLLRFCSHG